MSIDGEKSSSCDEILQHCKLPETILLTLHPNDCLRMYNNTDFMERYNTFHEKCGVTKDVPIIATRNNNAGDYTDSTATTTDASALTVAAILLMVASFMVGFVLKTRRPMEPRLQYIPVVLDDVDTDDVELVQSSGGASS